VPIRSPRGRGAAYRSLWQWPLRSPGRFIGCVLVLLAVLLAGNALLGKVVHRDQRPGPLDGPAAQAAPVPTQEAAPAPELTRLPPVPELSPATLPPADAPAAALAVATRWTQAWARHPAGTTTQSWVDGLRPYTTDEYLSVLATVDPSNVPANKITGKARPLLVSPNSVRVEVPTDTVDLVVLVVNDGQAWKVAGYDRAPGP
jgi:hypothetical protein